MTSRQQENSQHNHDDIKRAERRIPLTMMEPIGLEPIGLLLRIRADRLTLLIMMLPIVLLVEREGVVEREGEMASSSSSPKLKNMTGSSSSSGSSLMVGRVGDVVERNGVVERDGAVATSSSPKSTTVNFIRLFVD